MRPMRWAGYFAGLTVIFLSLFDPTRGQQYGATKLFGDDGRLFSSGRSDYYVLSIQPYMSEDSVGYQGKVRIVKKYEGGGYEVKYKDFIARCKAPFDHMIQIMWSESGKEDYSDTVPIKYPNKPPPPEARDSYNLYWAACESRFQKFH